MFADNDLSDVSSSLSLDFDYSDEYDYDLDSESDFADAEDDEMLDEFDDDMYDEESLESIAESEQDIIEPFDDIEEEDGYSNY
ncbi:MAG: hypothetical protein K6E51_11615 [Treponema sp.]|nr:hypothetical protein [Treponema sp.]